MAAKFGIAKLDGTNWPVWEMRVEALLAVEDLWEVVMEDVPAAEKQDAAWRSCDPKAKENIVSLLVDSQRSLVEGETHARDVFKSLKEHHQQVSRSAEHTQRGKARKCFRCGQPGHFKRSCPVRGGLRRKSEKEIAGKTATVSIEGTAAAAAAGTLEVQIAGCTEIETAESDEQDVALTTGVGRSANWVIDSGASAHMSNDRKFFSSLREFAGGHITVANGKQTEIRGEGSGVVYGIDGEEKPKKIDIGEVKFVPGLATNLLSVGKLAEKNYSVVFEKKSCSIVSAEGEVVATGRRHGGLYYLRQTKAAVKSMAAVEARHNEGCQHQWHRRLGHHDWAVAERIYKEGLATGMKVTDCEQRLVCECCEEGKSTNLPPMLGRKSKQLLDVVHASVCGPMRTVTPSGNRFVLTMVDDFSRFTVTYLLKRKCEAASGIKEYVRWVDSQFGRKPRVVRSDGGGVFNNTELRNFYKVEGIQPQFTNVRNGIAERKTKSLIEIAICMLSDAEMNMRFWGEAMLTATYLQNRMPIVPNQNTPYELWWGQKPDLEHLRVFGSRAYVNMPEKELIFVGYALDREAYRFVELETDKVTVSRDARFFELGDGITTVEWPSSEPAEEIQLKPIVVKEEFKEEEVGDNAAGDEEAEKEASESDDEEFFEAEGDEGGLRLSLRRSGRSNLGARPRYLDDYEVKHAVGIAVSAVEETAGRMEELKGQKWSTFKRCIQRLWL